MCSCMIFAFEGQNAEKKDFSVKYCLLAFNIVALGPVVSLELFVSRAYVASYPYLPTPRVQKPGARFSKDPAT